MQNRRYIAFIRHGDYHQLNDTPSAFQPFPLTQEGVGQAKVCASLILNFLNQHQVQMAPCIDSSQLLRAWQTADIIKNHLNQPNLSIESYIALAERSVGSVANLTTTQIEQVLEQDPRCETPPPGWKSDSQYCLPFPGAESLLQAGERVAQHIHTRLHKLPKQTLKLFVGHGASIRHAAYHLGILSFQEIAKLSMYHASPVIYSYDNGHWKRVAGEWKIRHKQDAID